MEDVYSRDAIFERFPRIGEPRKKIALVGFASTTRHMAPYDDKSWEIWGLNEGHRQSWMRRVTRHFQIHQRWDYSKDMNNKSYQEHWQWLQTQMDVPIYMQELDPDVPSAVKYPLLEIMDRLLPHLKREHPEHPGEYIVNKKVFGSSFAYMCALAVYESVIYGDIDTIGAWGFEMATDTEFKFQLPSTTFWIGQTTARDIEFVLPAECRILKNRLYGYEVSRMINRQRLEFYKNKVEIARRKAEASLNQINGRRQQAEQLIHGTEDLTLKVMYKDQAKALLEKEINAMAAVADLNGQIKMANQLINDIDNMHQGKDWWKGPMDDKEATGDVEYEPSVEMVMGGGSVEG